MQALDVYIEGLVDKAKTEVQILTLKAIILALQVKVDELEGRHEQ